MHRRALPLLLIVLLPAIASAQGVAAKRDSAVAKLNPGQQIRLSAEGMARQIGRAGVAVNDTLAFGQDDGVRWVPVSTIDTLWVRGQSAKDGAIIGGAMLGSLLGIFNLAWRGGCETYDCVSAPLAGLGGFLVGATVGAVLGGILGGSLTTWKRTYP